MRLIPPTAHVTTLTHFRRSLLILACTKKQLISIGMLGSPNVAFLFFVIGCAGKVAGSLSIIAPGEASTSTIEIKNQKSKIMISLALDDAVHAPFGGTPYRPVKPLLPRFYPMYSNEGRGSFPPFP